MAAPSPVPKVPVDAGLTISEYFIAIGPSYWNEAGKDIPRWPPDAFAMVASLLHRSGAYRRAVEKWPPQGGWENWIQGIGKAWRTAWATDTPLPNEVLAWWQIVQANCGSLVSRICENVDFCDALLQLSAAADESCDYVGMVHLSTPDNDRKFLHNAEVLIERNQTPATGESGACASLCDRIHVSRVRVLPKARTTQRGLTIRSFTHHLSLCYATEVLPKWHITPRSGENASRNFLNLLLVPWPRNVRPGHFSEIDAPPTDMNKRFGMFKMQTGEDDELVGHVQKAIASAEKHLGKIDGVVLPETAISPQESELLRPVLRKANVFLIAGICVPPGVSPLVENYVSCAFPLARGYVEYMQHKHHRWCMDRSQIINYGLSSRLDPNRVWWEGISIKDRQLHFFALENWLTTCVLICEDLARQDPVAEMVRCIGPNLVISLLADGPQLKTRWPHQYAAVLSDDPGSSVLCMTSIGMTGLSRPFDTKSPSRIVALWKDSRTGAVEIELAKDASGVVLSLFHERVEEFTADNRSDNKMASAIVLGGVHQVFP
jgi:hypothetical protein